MTARSTLLDEVSDEAFPAEFFFGDFNDDGRPDIGLERRAAHDPDEPGRPCLHGRRHLRRREDDFGFYGAAADLGGDARDDLVIGSFFYFCAFLTVDALPAPGARSVRPAAGEPPPDGGGRRPAAGGDTPADQPAVDPAPTRSIPPVKPPLTQPVIPVRANQIATLPSNRTCVSRRNFRIRLRRPPAGVTVSRRPCWSTARG